MTHGLDTDQAVYFYEQEFYVLSNFSAFRLAWLGHDHDTSEHAYHFTKFDWDPDAMLIWPPPPGGRAYHYTTVDWEAEPEAAALRKARQQVRHALLVARSAHEAFKLAEAHHRLVRPDWQQIRVDIMRQILRAKVEQHAYVRHKLLETGSRELVENSWRDSWWGWGPNKDGLNMLGKLWMEIRDELRKEKA